MFCACARCPLAYSAGVRTSSTIVPGCFMAVKKSLAAICWPAADETGLLAGVSDEQALIPVIAATARTAAAIRRDQDRVGRICMLFSPKRGERVLEVLVHGCEGEPSAGEVAGIEPLAEKYAGREVGTHAAGAVHSDRAPAR